MPNPPRACVVISTDGSYEVVRRSIELLSDQTKLEEIEILLVGPSIEEMQPDMHTLAKFGAHQVIETGTFSSTGGALVAGMDKAQGEILIYLEEHGFPPNDFIEKLLTAFDETGSNVVGFGLIPSNPGAVSWAHIYIQFGGAVPPLPSGDNKRLGPHHVAYRISALEPYRAHLADLLSNEAVLHEQMRKDGGRLFFHGDLYLLHAQISDFRQLMIHECLSGITFGHTRRTSQNWSVWRRALYVLGSPLIPFWRTLRAMNDMRRSGRLAELSPQVPLIMLCVSMAGAVGEVIGYTYGTRQWISDWRSSFELDRFAFVNEADKATAPRTADAARATRA